jgi:hypothetical protein
LISAGRLAHKTWHCFIGRKLLALPFPERIRAESLLRAMRTLFDQSAVLNLRKSLWLAALQTLQLYEHCL